MIAAALWGNEAYEAYGHFCFAHSIISLTKYRRCVVCFPFLCYHHCSNIGNVSASLSHGFCSPVGLRDGDRIYYRDEDGIFIGFFCPFRRSKKLARIVWFWGASNFWIATGSPTTRGHQSLRISPSEMGAAGQSIGLKFFWNSADKADAFSTDVNAMEPSGFWSGMEAPVGFLDENFFTVFQKSFTDFTELKESTTEAFFAFFRDWLCLSGIRWPMCFGTP